MIGLGIDAVDVDRFAEVLARQPRMAGRLFTDDERIVDATPRLAARFAVKEAVMKALGVGLGAFGWHDVETVRTAIGGARAGAPRRRGRNSRRAAGSRAGWSR